MFATLTETRAALDRALATRAQPAAPADYVLENFSQLTDPIQNAPSNMRLLEQAATAERDRSADEERRNLAQIQSVEAYHTLAEIKDARQAEKEKAVTTMKAADEAKNAVDAAKEKAKQLAHDNTQLAAATDETTKCVDRLTNELTASDARAVQFQAASTTARTHATALERQLA